jgi:hypothetical protein
MMIVPDFAKIATVLGVFAVVWAGVKWIFTPHVKAVITETITLTFGNELKEVPRLTLAVDRLTGVIERQNTDSERLATSMDALSGKVDGLSRDFNDLRERTASLEGMIASSQPKEWNGRERRETQRRHKPRRENP